MALLSTMITILIGASMMGVVNQAILPITGNATVQSVVTQPTNLTPFTSPVWALVFLVVMFVVLLIIWFVSHISLRRKRIE